jgi:hypothetical protein
VYRSKEAFFNKNNSEASKEAIKWSKMSLDVARLIKLWVMDSSAARKDLELALDRVTPDFGDVSDLDLKLDLATKEMEAFINSEEDKED